MSITYKETQRGIRLSCMLRGYKVTRLYCNHTLKEAVHLFKEYLRTL